MSREEKEAQLVPTKEFSSVGNASWEDCMAQVMVSQQAPPPLSSMTIFSFAAAAAAAAGRVRKKE